MGPFRAEMADRAAHEPQSRADGARADGLDLLGLDLALDVLVRAEFEIDTVRIFDGLLRRVRADERGQIAADLVAERKLAVGEGARAGKAGRDGAVGLAVEAAFCFRLGAVAVFHGLALFDDGDLFAAAETKHFHRGEDAGRAGADNDDVCFHREHNQS